MEEALGRFDPEHILSFLDNQAEPAVSGGSDASFFLDSTSFHHSFLVQYLMLG